MSVTSTSLTTCLFSIIMIESVDYFKYLWTLARSSDDWFCYREALLGFVFVGCASWLGTVPFLRTLIAYPHSEESYERMFAVSGEPLRMILTEFSVMDPVF